MENKDDVLKLITSDEKKAINELMNIKIKSNNWSNVVVSCCDTVIDCFITIVDYGIDVFKFACASITAIGVSIMGTTWYSQYSAALADGAKLDNMIGKMAESSLYPLVLMFMCGIIIMVNTSKESKERK